MAGHSKWKQIKHKKARTDQDRGKLFSKLSQAVTIAARGNPDPKFNPALRRAIEQARRSNMPQINIDKAIKRASQVDDLTELVVEAYGPEGVGILIKIITDNSSQTIAEIRKLLKVHNAKVAEPGSLAWAFEQKDGKYFPRFTSAPSAASADQLKVLISDLRAREDVVDISSTLK